MPGRRRARWYPCPRRRRPLLTPAARAPARPDRPSQGRFIMKISIRLLSCAVVAARCCFGAAPAWRSRPTTARLAELARDAARQFEAARAADGPDAADDPRHRAGAAHRADARRGHGARARAQPRHRRRAAEPADPGLQPGAAARGLSADRDLALRASRRRAAADQPVERRHHRPERHVDLQRRASRRRCRGAAATSPLQFNNNKQVTSNTVRQLQPDLQRELQRHDHAAAAARLPDRRHAAAAAGHRDQPRHLRDPAARHARDRPSPTCATRTGSWSSRCRRVDVATGLARPRRQAGRRTTGRASKSARWRRSTSCRRRPKRPPGGRRWRRPRRRWRTAELALKRLIVNGTDDPLWRATITPIDRPEFRAEPLDVEGAVRRALADPHRSRAGAQDARQQRHHAAVPAATRRCRRST